MFAAPTVAALAALLSTARDGQAGAAGRPTGPDALPLSYAQHRLWFIDQAEGPSATYNVPVALRLRGQLDHPALEAALADVVARHEVLRTVFLEVDGTPVQRILPDRRDRSSP